MVASATGSAPDDRTYQFIRRVFMDDPETRERLPNFVRQYRNLGAFWPFIKEQNATYAGRRQFLSEAFTPLIGFLEQIDRHPGDMVVSAVIVRFDADGIRDIWDKALSRRSVDPEGAITAARTLLETVCKHVLEELDKSFTDKDDLPKLYANVAEALTLAPSQHSEDAIRAILGGAMNLVNGIGTLRNRLSDSHGRGGKLPVRPAQRHASLAVNMAGAMATFIIETHLEKRAKS